MIKKNVVKIFILFIVVVAFCFVSACRSNPYDDIINGSQNSVDSSSDSSSSGSSDSSSGDSSGLNSSDDENSGWSDWVPVN